MTGPAGKPEISDAVAALFDSVSSGAASSLDVLPHAAAMAADKRKREAARKEAEEEFMKNLRPGQLMPDGTIYLGKYTPGNRNGRILSTTFNVFAAPEDLPRTMTYVEAVDYVSRGWYGTNYANDKEIYKALADGSYNGGWIIPPRELLSGMAADERSRTRQGPIVQPDNLFDHRKTGAFKNTFKTAASPGFDFTKRYWSSSSPSDDPSFVGVASFSDGSEEWIKIKFKEHFSCRLVRLEPVVKPG